MKTYEKMNELVEDVKSRQADDFTKSTQLLGVAQGLTCALEIIQDKYNFEPTDVEFKLCHDIKNLLLELSMQASSASTDVLFIKNFIK